jgi:hypothetical protein
MLSGAITAPLAGVSSLGFEGGWFSSSFLHPEIIIVKPTSNVSKCKCLISKILNN